MLVTPSLYSVPARDGAGSTRARAAGARRVPPGGRQQLRSRQAGGHADRQSPHDVRPARPRRGRPPNRVLHRRQEFQGERHGGLRLGDVVTTGPRLWESRALRLRVLMQDVMHC